VNHAVVNAGPFKLILLTVKSPHGLAAVGVGVTAGVAAGVGEVVGPNVLVAEAVAVEVAWPDEVVLIARSSKFVSQPLLLLIVTLERGSSHLVLSVSTWPTATHALTVGWPAQATVTVLEMPPPLYAVSRSSRPPTRNVKLAIAWFAPVKLMLLEEN
jgi:hypothetical protein